MWRVLHRHFGTRRRVWRQPRPLPDPGPPLDWPEKLTWRQALASTMKLQELPTIRCIACLNEIIGLAFKAQETRELQLDATFKQLIGRSFQRLFGFEGRDAKLLLATTARLPGVLSAEQLEALLDQILEDEADLDDVQFAEIGQLMAQIALGDAHIVAWTEYGRILARRAPDFRAKAFTIAMQALTVAPVSTKAIAAGKLQKSLMESALPMLKVMSPHQLTTVSLASAQLGLLDDMMLQGEAFLLLGELVESMTPAHNSAALATCALVGSDTALEAINRLLCNTGPAARAHAWNAEDAIQALCALSLLRNFPVELCVKLMKRAVSVPRTSLSESDDFAVHQVALSVMYEPTAQQLLEAVQGDLWDTLYQPLDVPPEATDSRDFESLGDNSATIFQQTAASCAWFLETDVGPKGPPPLFGPDGFYYVAGVMRRSSDDTSDGNWQVAIDIDRDAPRRHLWRQLKHRHLRLSGLRVLAISAAEWRGLDVDSKRKFAEVQCRNLPIE